MPKKTAKKAKPAKKKAVRKAAPKTTRAFRVIGLTGNIACGKSSVAAILRKRGYSVLDADQLSRDLSAKGGEAYEKIVQEFGAKVLDENGAIDRMKLRAIVFEYPTLRKTLEAILHPLIQKRSMEYFKKLAVRGEKLAFYEASLLLEAGRKRDFSGVLVVTCPEPRQLQRLRARDPSITETVARQILEAQLPQAEKAAMADWVIENKGTLKELEASVDRWLKKLS